MVHQFTWGVVEETVSLGGWGGNEFDLEHVEFEVLDEDIRRVLGI